MDVAIPAMHVQGAWNCMALCCPANLPSLLTCLIVEFHWIKHVWLCCTHLQELLPVTTWTATSPPRS
jgi:hypothetical protein